MFNIHEAHRRKKKSVNNKKPVTQTDDVKGCNITNVSHVIWIILKKKGKRHMQGEKVKNNNNNRGKM